MKFVRHNLIFIRFAIAMVLIAKFEQAIRGFNNMLLEYLFITSLLYYRYFK